jgi:quinol monooxygenase YgiN
LKVLSLLILAAMLSAQTPPPKSPRPDFVLFSPGEIEANQLRTAPPDSLSALTFCSPTAPDRGLRLARSRFQLPRTTPYERLFVLTREEPGPFQKFARAAVVEQWQVAPGGRKKVEEYVVAMGARRRALPGFAGFWWMLDRSDEANWLLISFWADAQAAEARDSAPGWDEFVASRRQEIDILTRRDGNGVLMNFCGAEPPAPPETQTPTTGKKATKKGRSR